MRTASSAGNASPSPGPRTRSPSEVLATGRQASAMTAIEMRTPGGGAGCFAPLRAGGSVGNQRAHSSFMPGKSSGWLSTKVALTTRSIELPAASRMACTLRSAWRVCSWMVSPTTWPVAGSMGP